MRLKFAGHWLAFLWIVKTIGALKAAVQKAVEGKATSFELIYHALNKLVPKDTAQALKGGGVTHASMCVFFPTDESMGDPLGDGEGYKQALKTFRRVLKFMVALRSYGITINKIVGPSCFVLAKDYGLDWSEKKRRILRFYGDLSDDLEAAGVDVAIEMLRRGENYVIEEVAGWITLIDDLNNAYGGVEFAFGAHLDTFHMDELGRGQGNVIERLGARILHLHLNGTGRRPAGANGDNVDWQEVIEALQEVDINELVATNEPFCQLVRDECPPLAEGLPSAVDEPGGMIATRQMLEGLGVMFMTA
ncbi:hypothetical protein A2881_00715 [Candidatus Peribacteria bacterium RIFCSPHIGHO2_01_FULL_55_13]|nr:MAG: hypothetical protein A2881_00715 [Candidatus Peribacteria bacterium RIFCSPHIGHO2_01_FULL_55_13]